MRFIHSMVATVFREIYPLLRDLSIPWQGRFVRFIHLRAGGGVFCEIYPFPGRDVSWDLFIHGQEVGCFARFIHSLAGTFREIYS